MILFKMCQQCHTTLTAYVCDNMCVFDKEKEDLFQALLPVSWLD